MLYKPHSVSHTTPDVSSVAVILGVHQKISLQYKVVFLHKPQGISSTPPGVSSVALLTSTTRLYYHVDRFPRLPDYLKERADLVISYRADDARCQDAVDQLDKVVCEYRLNGRGEAMTLLWHAANGVLSEYVSMVNSTHSNHVTSSQRVDTLICHTTMCRHSINFLYNSGHMTL